MNTADKKRKSKGRRPIIGKGNRFPKEKVTPGPDYFPDMKPEVKREPAYSITMKRNVKGMDPIKIIRGTD